MAKKREAGRGTGWGWVCQEKEEKKAEKSRRKGRT